LLGKFFWFFQASSVSKNNYLIRIRLRCEINQKNCKLLEKELIISVIEKFFDSGKTKNFAPLREIQLDDPNFSSFSDVPPYELQDYKTTLALEELRFVSISDYNYEIKNPKISIYGDSAVVAFELIQKGMLVDNKAYTGEFITIHNRATFVLIKKPTWKIAHIHLSMIKNN